MRRAGDAVVGCGAGLDRSHGSRAGSRAGSRGGSQAGGRAGGRRDRDVDGLLLRDGRGGADGALGGSRG